MRIYEKKTFKPLSRLEIEDTVNKEGKWSGLSDEWKYGAVNDLTIARNDQGKYDCSAKCPDIIFLEVKNVASFDIAFKYLEKLNAMIIDLYYSHESDVDNHQSKHG